jgi:hypothetical protein
VFNNAGSRSDYITSNGRITELERMWKEAVLAQFEIRSWHLAGCTEETTCSLRSLSQDLNPGLPEYAAEVHKPLDFVW